MKARGKESFGPKERLGATARDLATRAASLDRFAYPRDLLADDAIAADAPREASEATGDEWADDARWWMAYVKSRQEKRLSEQLSDLRVRHYLPVHFREAATRGRLRLVEEPLFSGYLFLHASDEERRRALTTNRICATHAVADGRRLAFELRQIQRSIASGARLTVEAQIEPGDWVRVKSGVHIGLEGRVLRRQSKTRLQLSVDFLGQGASLEIHDSLLEVIDPPALEEAPTIEIVGRPGL